MFSKSLIEANSRSTTHWKIMCWKEYEYYPISLISVSWDLTLCLLYYETPYFEITEMKDRVSALKIYGGREIKKLARNLPDTAPVVGDDDNKKLERKLDNYFLPKKSKHHGRFAFSKQRPIELRRECCHIRGATARKIKGLRVWRANGWQNSWRRSIQKQWNLDKFLEEASQREDINQQVKDIKEDFNVSKVEHQWEDFPKNGKWGGRGSSKKPPRPPRRQEHKKEEKKKGKSCGYCGKTVEHTLQAEIAQHTDSSA